MQNVSTGLEIGPGLGWNRCARLHNGATELLVSLEVGPRILSYRTGETKNVLQPQAAEMGTGGEAEFVVRGGHRFWISPETERTYAPDNTEVEWRSAGPSSLLVANAASEPWHIRKQMTITLGEGSHATIDHRLTNEGREPVEIAAWALTILRPGGIQIIPQPPLGQHGLGGFLPERVLVPWSYTDLSDSRWRLGCRYHMLRPEPSGPPTKLGYLLSTGWVAYVLPDALFIKTVAWQKGARYPDLGCNYETFSKGDFVELETLSPLQLLAQGESITHREEWHLFSGIPGLDTLNEAGVAEWLRPFLARINLS